MLHLALFPESLQAGLWFQATEKEGVLMTKFSFSAKHLSIVDAQGHHVDLDPQEAVELLQWLSDRRTMLLRLSQQDTEQRDGGREQIEIRLQQQHLVHLDALQAAIPQLQEHTPAANIFVSPADSVTERAIQLLNAFQIEYKIHPLLEEDGVFAQG
jgi:hypothetical protein